MESKPDLPPPRPHEPKVLSVSALNQQVRGLLEARLELLWVGGEISNALRAASGHWYFSLKDENAQVRCVLFKQRANALPFPPANGLQVEVCARPSLYEPRGEFQLGVETMRRAGLGALFEAFEKLKAKLAGEGLFDAGRKKELPLFPRAIGVVTSLKAAALRDVLTTLQRRAPMTAVIVYPTAVQGAGAGAEIAAAIDRARERREVETLIVCRGGGSVEDLWSFNEEIVARAIARLQDQTTIAVVSGVGHETDFTICDFVADRRAPTPTAAAEMASPDRAQWLALTAERRQALRRGARRLLEMAGQRLDRATRALWSPGERLARERERLGAQQARLRQSMRSAQETAGHRLALAGRGLRALRPEPGLLQRELARSAANLRESAARSLSEHGARIDALRQSLTHLSPLQVLARGYGIVEHRGRIVRDARALQAGEDIAVRLAQGSLDATVTIVKP